MAVIGTFGEERVILENAASEETLQQLVQVAQQGFGSAGNNIISAGQAAAMFGRQAGKTGKELENTGYAAESAAGGLRDATTAGLGFARTIARSGARMAQGMRTLSNSPFMVADTMVQIMDKMGDQAPGILKVLGVGLAGAAAGSALTIGDAIEGALVGGLGSMFAAIAPGISSILAGTFVRVLKDTTENFTTLQKNGAILGGSLTEARLAAHGAGLTLGQFSNVMGRAGAEMSMFGGQTRRGAQLFGDLNKAVTTGQTGRQLLQLGIGFEDMGIRTAEMIAHLAESGISFESNAVAVSTARDRVVELARQQKALAALNGTTIEQEKEKQRMARKDAQLNAIMLGMGDKERQGLQQLTSQFPQFSQFIKETVAFGGPVSKGALMQQAQMGATTEALGNTIQQILAGGGQGAIDAFKQLQATSPALQADLANQAELVKLSLVSQNQFVQTAQENFQSQFEIFTKANQQTMQSIVDDFEFMSNENDKLTNTITRLQSAQQDLTIEMTKTATALISQTGAVQNLMVGTTETLRDTLGFINDRMGVRSGLNATGAVTDTNPRPIQDLANAIQNAAPTTTAAATASQTATTTQGLVTVSDPVIAGLQQQMVDLMNRLVRSSNQIATNTQ